MTGITFLYDQSYSTRPNSLRLNERSVASVFPNFVWFLRCPNDGNIRKYSSISWEFSLDLRRSSILFVAIILLLTSRCLDSSLDSWEFWISFSSAFFEQREFIKIYRLYIDWLVNVSGPFPILQNKAGIYWLVIKTNEEYFPRSLIQITTINYAIFDGWIILPNSE